MKLEQQKEEFEKELGYEIEWKDKVTWGYIELRGTEAVMKDLQRVNEMLIFCQAILDLHKKTRITVTIVPRQLLCVI